MHRTACSVLALSAALIAGPLLAQPTPTPTAATTKAPSEDARLAAFFQEAFMEAARLSPETLSQIGLKERYDELGDYTFAGQKKAVGLAESRLAQMRREFDPAKLNEASRLSFALFEKSVATQKTQFRWYWQTYAVASFGGPLDGVPVFLINSTTRTRTCSCA